MTAVWDIDRSAAMWWRQAAWNLRAARRQKPSRPLRFDRAARNRVLLVSLGDPISQSQIYPFHFYAREAKRAYGTQILELGLDPHLQRPELAPPGADVVCFQAWIGKSAEELRAIVGCLRERNPGSKLVFLDPFAPADLRYAAPLGPLIDLYVKKHVLRERSRYGEPTSGDTNLTDWYGKRFGLDQPTVRFDIPEGFFSKLVVGPSFVTSPNMLPDFARGRFPDPARPRHIDLHARIGGGGGNSWYGRMRTESLAAVRALGDVGTSGTGLVGKRTYQRELACAKACFSPFGYGEVSWRDYEAIHAGAMLLKPDTSHIETSPDTFIANQTYVPLAWDFSDLQRKLAHFLKHPDERIALARAAFATLHRYAAENVFVQQMERILSAQP